MGNNICQCKTICQTKVEENLSSSNLSTTYNYYKNKSRNKVINSISSISSKENLNSIYRKNCAQKIIKTYLQFKENKMKKINNDIKNKELIYVEEEEKDNKSNNKKEIEAYDNLDQYSINHPFYIDKIHKSKTVYGKFYIPKINNGKSLETLNRNTSAPYIIYNEKKIHRKRKNK